MGALFSILAHKLGAPSIANVDRDGLRLRQFEVSIDDVRQVGEVHAKVTLGCLPLTLVNAIIPLVLKIDASKLKQVAVGVAAVTRADVPITKSWTRFHIFKTIMKIS